QRSNGPIQVGILAAAAIVKVNDVIQIRQTAVVHVGGRNSDVAKRWRLKTTPVGVLLADRESSDINRLLIPAYSGVVKILIREIRSGMTAPAATPTLIQP